MTSGEELARKNPGKTIRTEYDDEGREKSSSIVENEGKPAVKVSGGGLTSSSSSVKERLKGVSSKLSKALEKKKMSEAEIDEEIRITNKKAALARAKTRYSQERKARISSSVDMFGSFMGGSSRPASSNKKKQIGGVGSSSEFEFYGMGDFSKSQPINSNFSYYDWTFGGKKTPNKGGKDWAKEYYGI